MLDTPLSAAVYIGTVSIVVELLSIFARGPVKKFGYGLMIVTASFSASAILVFDPSIATLLMAYVSLFRVINGLRVVNGRMKQPKLTRVTRRSSIVLLAMVMIAAGLWYLGGGQDLYSVTIVYPLSITALIGGLVILWSTSRNLKKSVIHPSDKYTPDMELPTISVCIPARNETDDLSPCLTSVLASDYPKLEVLVLDDCSQDKTSEIIKGFAHSGVRFVAGDPIKDGWLAKNQAYQYLAEAASGQILVFSGVDVRFDKHTLRSLVSSMTARNKNMISVMPKGLQQLHHAGLMQPIRYWWELALPRRLFNRPPVLSTLWAIKRESYDELGGMKAVRNNVIPEGYFARELVKSDSYSFMRSSGKLSVSSAKKLADQWQTAIRVKYPSLRQRPENVALIVLAEIWLMAMPVTILIVGFFVSLGPLWIIAGVNAWILIYVHMLIVKSWNADSVDMALVAFPAAIVVEIAVTLVSMWRYEFAEVKWKDRDVCIPVMRSYTRLPKS